MKKLRKLWMMPVATLVVACFLTGFASAAGVGTVNASTYLNVRKYGNTGAPIIGKLSSGTRVETLTNVNGWYEISYNGSTAWVSGQYIVNDSRVQTVVTTAKNELGVPYAFGGATPSAFDCSGLTMYVYNKIGVSLVHKAATQATQGVWVSRSSLLPGDLVFFDTDGGNNNITHVGIYIGGGEFISAQSGAGMVKEASLSNSYWSAAYMTARRVIR